ncbi:uncharacterized protein BDZ99DRAFT_401009, partial [Mytilinidion resinicola]
PKPTIFNARLRQYEQALKYTADFEKTFAQYMESHDFEAAGRSGGLRMEEEHTIIEIAPFRLKMRLGDPGAKQEILRALVSEVSPWIRYVE